jgi:tryptophan-rich sensory protein
MRSTTLATTAAAVAATALAGSAASRDVRSRWYARLRKPPIQPPGAVFPVVWTALYADIAVSSAATLDALRADGRDAEAAAFGRALAANLVLNGTWSWVFFRWHRLGAAVAVAAALAASSADLARRAGRARPAAGAALGPYAAWCSFATVLSAEIWRRNR